MLSSVGAVVIKASNGQEAIEIFEKSEVGEIDIILMDVMMPGVDGLAATRIIRSMSREDAKTIPIIAMTANAFSVMMIKRKSILRLILKKFTQDFREREIFSRLCLWEKYWMDAACMMLLSVP